MANIKVAVRVRPISEREIHLTGSEIVVHTEPKVVSLTNLKVSSSKAGDSRERTRRYGFNYCFDSSEPGSENYASQAKIYETLGESILDALFKGYNSCLVAYGQSASGKTYTMMGSKEDPGLTPRICEGLFLRLANEEKTNQNFDVSVSYLEVYNERVRDLLRPTSSSIGLRVREHPRLGPYVQGLTRHAVPTLASLISRVEEGTRARKTASTLQNPTSSRSHALLTLTLLPSTSNLGQSVATSASVPSGVTRKNDFPRGSKLHLVDLAGSESAAACGGINRLKEGANINKSLVALGNVISALAERGSTGTGPGRRFIPYRDSALTWLLKDALGGNATTVMLATISPASGSYNETSHTLRFAQRAQSVVNRPVINEDPVSRIIRELRAEVARLKCLLQEKNVNPDLDCKSTCLCQCNQEQKAEQGLETRAIDSRGREEEDETPIEVNHSRISERRHSTSESPVSKKELPSPVRRFASFETVHESTSSSRVLEAGNYNQAKVSELIIDDEVDEPVFVDIPTLVAVLIKPDNNIQVNSHQIEEIYSDGPPEDVIDAEFQESSDRDNLRESNVFQNFQNNGRSIENNSSVEVFDSIQFSPKPEVSSEPSIHPRRKTKLRKQDSIDGDLSSKRSSNLQTLKKYGSIESLTRKKEIACSIQPSNTNLEKRNGSLDKIKKLNNIKEVDDQKLSKLGNSWRNVGTWASRDLQRKGSNDSDKSLKDSGGVLKAKSQTRKQSIDCLKRKTSKDSSSSSSKDELLAITAVPPDRASRKGSLDQEQIPTRPLTSFQRARRAEIVAAVTERLYSSKKFSEDNNTATAGTTASTPASEVRSPESSDVKLASTTRMRLQEISRKMLAKRRRICVDTQTDNQQTLRVRDTASLTEEPQIISKDASILTDRHEDYETLPSIACPVLRVKEMSTLTDSNHRQPVIRCKDAGNVTDDSYEDYATIRSPRNDSGIMSDDTQNYADSNLSSAEDSDLFAIAGRKSAELVENSTNTRIPSGPPNMGSQTRREDLVETNCPCYKTRCCAGPRNYQGNNVLNHNQSYHHVETNVISISLPDMVSITIESSNGLESKIKVFEGIEQTDERTSINFKDIEVQTDAKDAQEIGTSTDDAFGQVCFNDFTASAKPIIAQTDGKTFRIENIFHEPRSVTRIAPTIEIVPNTSDNLVAKNSLIVTNSIGTSIVPETRENATGMERGRSYSSRMFLGATARRRSVTNDTYMKNTWPTRWRSSSPNSRRQASYPVFGPIAENHRSCSISMSDLGWEDYYRSTDSQKTKGQLAFNTTGLIVDKIGLRTDEMRRKERNDVFKISEDDVPVIASKAPSIITMTDGKNGLEQDMNFSDDSLDPMEDAVKNGRNNSQSLLASSQDNVTKTRETDKICPPDVVAHTKKDTTKGESLISSDNSSETPDFEDSLQIEFPKTKLDCMPPSSFPTPLSDLKLLILGDPCYTANHTDDSDLPDFGSQSSTSTLRVDDEGCYSSVDFVEGTEQYSVNGERPVAPKSIMRKVTRRSKNSQVAGEGQSDCGSKNVERQNACKKRVRFAIPEVFEVTSSESEINENLTSEDEMSDEGPRTILEEYLDEAVVFMRNMNSMNEYMNAACAFDKYKINGRNRYRGKSKSSNYIEYEGRRISLDDDTDQYLKSDDEDLNFNVKSYEKCLRSMDKLEECLAKVKRHDEILRDNYGIGNSGSTGARLDLAKFSIDSKGSSECHNYKDKFDDPKTMNSSNLKNPTTSEENIDVENNNLLLHEEEDKVSASDANKTSENLKKARSRRFSKFSDIRKKNPTTYSQLRGRYSSQSADIQVTTKENTLGFDENVECSEIDVSTSTTDADSLQTPDCYLILPKTKSNGGDPSEGIKSSNPRPRFSLSKYDSSNESSSSNEALATFMESIDNVARSRDKFKYPGSPRAKFLQLLSERRRIVENTRSTGAS